MNAMCMFYNPSRSKILSINHFWYTIWLASNCGIPQTLRLSICGIPQMDDRMRYDFIPYVVDHLWNTIYGQFSVYGITQMDVNVWYL